MKQSGSNKNPLFISVFACLVIILMGQPIHLRGSDVYWSLESALENSDKVRALLLDDQGLADLPLEILRLSNLRNLSISDNDLTALPAAIGNLKQLRMLDATRNKIAELPPSIGQLKELDMLFLHDNLLWQLPGSIGKLSNLRTLVLSNNQLREIPAEIGKLSNVWTLDLSNNKLREIPAEIGRLSNLHTLDLSNNQLEKLPPKVAELTSLRMLDLTNNQLTELPPELASLADRPSVWGNRGSPGQVGPNRLYGAKNADSAHAKETALPLFLEKTVSAAADSFSPVERAAKLADFVDSLEAGKVPTEPPPEPGDLEIAFERLRMYLEANPEDVQSMILYARLGRTVDLSTPVVTTEGEEMPSSDDGLAPLNAVLDRALSLEPDNAEAHYWQARLYGVTVPTTTDDGLLMSTSRDLSQAIFHTRRAVELKPSKQLYREALALYLFEAGLNKDAIDVMRVVDGGKHPIYLLLSDLEALPLPETAAFLPVETKRFAEMQMNRGRYENYPYLRVRLYTFSGSATELEAFFRTYWPELKLFEHDREETEEGIVMRMLAQHFRWRRGNLQPGTERNVSKSVQNPKGILLMIQEIHNPTESMRQQWGQSSADPFCVLSIMNSSKK